MSTLPAKCPAGIPIIALPGSVAARCSPLWELIAAAGTNEGCPDAVGLGNAPASGVERPGRGVSLLLAVRRLVSFVVVDVVAEVVDIAERPLVFAGAAMTGGGAMSRSSWTGQCISGLDGVVVL